jgi:hypothetical protein
MNLRNLAIKIIDQCEREIDEIEELLYDFIPFARKRLKFKSFPPITLKSDSDNADLALGKTAYYDPEHYSVTVFVDGRHVKDILRSIAHELVHHRQNEKGKFKNVTSAGRPGYAQEDMYLRGMEEEAYLLGNMCFRDWEDQYKATNYNNELTEWSADSMFDALKNYFTKGSL